MKIFSFENRDNHDTPGRLTHAKNGRCRSVGNAHTYIAIFSITHVNGRYEEV